MVVDDEPGICQVLEAILTRDQHEVQAYTDPVQALEAFQADPVDIVIHDLKMPRLSGIELMAAIKECDPRAICIVITAFDTWDNAVEAMRRGAYTYLKKPFDNEDIRAIIDRACAQLRLARSGGDDDAMLRNIVGNNPVIRGIEAIIRRVAPTDSTVLIQGENGTGKELLARAVHHLSLRKHGPFTPLNCAGLTDSLLESELFGHVRGAFTGAVADRMGYFETAAGGTLFMDEIAEMPISTQVKVLRVLEDRVVVPVGSSMGRRVDVRIIAATNRDLEAEVQEGRFREDLFYRLNVIPIRPPPLRERKDDIPAMAGFFLATYGRKVGKPARRFSAAAMETLLTHDWPGNVRELQNTIERAVTMCASDEVGPDDLHLRWPTARRDAGHAVLGDIPEGGLDIEQELARVEREYMRLALERSEGNQTRAAELLGMSFRQFRYKAKKYDLRGSRADDR
jgi:two-component system response regulator PilR (NtrC family)